MSGDLPVHLAPPLLFLLPPSRSSSPSDRRHDYRRSTGRVASAELNIGRSQFIRTRLSGHVYVKTSAHVYVKTSAPPNPLRSAKTDQLGQLYSGFRVLAQDSGLRTQDSGVCRRSHEDRRFYLYVCRYVEDAPPIIPGLGIAIRRCLKNGYCW